MGSSELISWRAAAVQCCESCCILHLECNRASRDRAVGSNVLYFKGSGAA